MQGIFALYRFHFEPVCKQPDGEFGLAKNPRSHMLALLISAGVHMACGPILLYCYIKKAQEIILITSLTVIYTV